MRTPHQLAFEIDTTPGGLSLVTRKLKRKDEIREKCSKIYDVRLVSCRNERPSQSKGACQNSGTLPRS